MDKKLIRKTLQAVETKQAEGEDRTLVVKISTKAVDRSGDIVEPKGVVLDNYIKNPVVAAFHDYRGPAIGRTEEIKVTEDGEGIMARVKFPPAGTYALADTLYSLYKQGFMSAWSIGFMPLEWEDMPEGGRHFKKWELFEYSAVLVPDNPGALTMLRTKGVDTAPLEEALEAANYKGVVPYKETPKAPEDAAWNASEEMAALWGDGKNQAKYAQAHTWYDSSANDDDGDNFPDVKNAYKLPHHDRSLKVVWRGVAAAMAALLGARGGVKIPDSDKKGVYNHLAKHYKDFGKEPPEFRSYSAEEITKMFGETEEKKDVAETVALANLVDFLSFLLRAFKDNGVSEDVIGRMKQALEILMGVLRDEAELGKKMFVVKEGRVLSDKNRKLISEAISQMSTAIKALDDLLKATEPAQASVNDNGVINGDTKSFILGVREELRKHDKNVGLFLRDINDYLKSRNQASPAGGGA